MKEWSQMRKQTWWRKKAKIVDKSDATLEGRNKTPEDSPRTETERMVSGCLLRNPKIRKALLFHNVLCQEQKMDKTVSRKLANVWPLTLSGKILKKYRFRHQIRQFGLTDKLMSKNKQTAQKSQHFSRVSARPLTSSVWTLHAWQQIELTPSPGKGSSTGEWSWLTPWLISIAISSTGTQLSYSSFCALRLFYIMTPKASDRKTCLCHFHENAASGSMVIRCCEVNQTRGQIWVS